MLITSGLNISPDLNPSILLLLLGDMPVSEALFRKVLIPTDFSLYADAVLGCVKDLRGLQDVVLLNVIDRRLHLGPELSVDTLSQTARDELAKLEKTFRDGGPVARSLVKVGIPPREIVMTADEEDASVIVMGARGTSLFRELFLGSTTADVMRHSRKPVLIIRFKLVKKLGNIECERVCQDLLGKILFATDFSEQSRRALGLLQTLKESGAKELVLVHVVDRGENEEEAQALRAAAEKELTGLEHELREKGWRVKSIATIGIASKEIISIANAENASVIAVGARGKGIIEELLVGSTAEAIARRADRPVLILR
jgi:nucleotide-binding universal stress UspA family protein